MSIFSAVSQIVLALLTPAGDRRSAKLWSHCLRMPLSGPPAQPLSLPLACQVTASSPEARAQPEPLRSCPKESDHVAESLAERPGNGRGLWDNGWQATGTSPQTGPSRVLHPELPEASGVREGRSLS